MSDMKWAPLIGAIIISTASWNAIPEDLRPKLLAQSRAAGASMQIEIDKADNDAISIMKQHGLKVHAASKEAVDGWKSLADNSLPKLAGKSYDSKSYDMVKKYLDEFRSNQKNRQ
jgi:TRAP-type C4-dicarboxylate transport system substrate-binding protein